MICTTEERKDVKKSWEGKRYASGVFIDPDTQPNKQVRESIARVYSTVAENRRATERGFPTKSKNGRILSVRRDRFFLMTFGLYLQMSQD